MTEARFLMRLGAQAGDGSAQSAKDGLDGVRAEEGAAEKASSNSRLIVPDESEKIIAQFARSLAC
jgi:hypothetical protein